MALPCCESFPIPRRTSPTKEEFRKDYLLTGRPVIIEGALTDWPARLWTLESLQERVGAAKIMVRGNTNVEDYKLGRKYTIRATNVKQYIDDLKADNARARSSYMAVQNIKQAFPELQAEAPLPEYVEKVHGGPYLWVARKGHYEYCHIDPDDGMLIMIQGSKQVRLFGCDVEPMYPNAKGSKGRTVQSQVDCNCPDLQQHPEFVKAKCHYGVVEPGEMLYIPAFWWHQITSLDTAISINIFWGNEGNNTFLSKVMREPVMPIFTHWLLNVIEQNRYCGSFPRTLSRLPESLYNFLYNQWYEAATEEQLQTLIELIMAYLGISQLPNEKSGGKIPPLLKIRGLLSRS